MTGLGAGHYLGDLGSGLNGGQLAISIGLKLNKNKRLNSNLIVNIGSLKGNELDYSFDDGSGTPTTPNESFETSYISLNYEAHLNIIHKEKFQLYISQGIGIFRFVPKDTEGDNLADQPGTRALGEDYRNISIMLPSQIGLVYYLPNEFGLGIQGGYLNPMTDYLDNISNWGKDSGNDKVLYYRMSLSIPINF